MSEEPEGASDAIAALVADLKRMGCGLEVRDGRPRILAAYAEDPARAEAAVKRALPLLRDHRAEVVQLWAEPDAETAVSGEPSVASPPPAAMESSTSVRSRAEVLAAAFERAGPNGRVWGHNWKTGRGGLIDWKGRMLPGWWDLPGHLIDRIWVQGEPTWEVLPPKGSGPTSGGSG